MTEPVIHLSVFDAPLRTRNRKARGPVSLTNQSTPYGAGGDEQMPDFAAPHFHLLRSIFYLR